MDLDYFKNIQTDMVKYILVKLRFQNVTEHIETHEYELGRYVMKPKAVARNRTS